MPGSHTPSRPLHWPTMLWIGLLVALVLLLGIAATVVAQGGDITRGSQIFDANCAVCHGTDGQGRVGANLSQDFPSINPNAFLRQIIANGVKGTTMPAWSQAQGGPLTKEDIDDVVAFVESLSGGRSEMAPTATPLPVTPVPTVPGVSGDPGLGRVLFAENCAMCHGDRGQGVVGAKLAKDFPSINPQQFVRTTVARGVPGTVMPAWSQENGGPLTQEEIDHISAYIISLSREAEQPGQQPVTQPTEPEKGGIPWPLLALVGLIVFVVLVVLVLQFSGGSQSTE